MSDKLSDFCNQINRNASIELAKRKNKMSKSNWSNITEGMGCFALVGLLILVLLLIVPILLFIGATITGGLIWLGWNLALVPIFALTPINMWWQAWGLGLLVAVVSGAIKGVVKIKGD